VSVNLSIKEVPDDVADRLRQRAARNHRSLQGELMAIVFEAASAAPPPEPAADRQGVRVQGWKTVEDLIAERKLRPLVSTPGVPLAVDIVRADRDSR
jgi:antitoxin FitA